MWEQNVERFDPEKVTAPNESRLIADRRATENEIVDLRYESQKVR
jgi:hypothetical protein